MAKKSPLGMPLSSKQLKNDGSIDFIGTKPEISKETLEPTNRTVTSKDQALAICDNLARDARILIKNAARITLKKQGARPYRQSVLDEQGRKWMPNVSSGAFGTELRRAAPRLYMPLLQASTLTAASLPPGWSDGETKSQFFRESVTEAIRSWRKWGMFCRGLAKEVVDYGFTFAAWTNPYEWRPHLVRMDKGFVSRGTEIMEDNVPFFMLEIEYKPDELLTIAKKAIESGSEDWDKEAVAIAVEKADAPRTSRTEEHWRKWEELIKEQVRDFSYTKGFPVVRVRHLFALEATGQVSHYILAPDSDGDHVLLYECLDAYTCMNDVVVPLVFDFGDGTIHGSWGAGHMLYDLADMLDKARCDMIANLKLQNKVRLEVADGKAASDAKLIINSDMVIAENGSFAQQGGQIGASTTSFIELDGEMTKWMQERIGAYLPPVPTQPNTVTASQTDAVMDQQQEIQKDVLEMWLSQFAFVIQSMVRRLLDPDTDDEVGIALRKKLLGDASWYTRLYTKIKSAAASLIGINTMSAPRLSEEELDILVNQPVITSIQDYTPYAAAQRAQFAAAVKGDSRFDQVKAATIWAEGVPGGGSRLAKYLVIAQGDNTLTADAQRMQLMENTTMLASGKPSPVVATDNDWVHMQTLKGVPEGLIQGGQVPQAAALLQHYTAHYVAGVAKKGIPPDQINAEKAYVAKLEKALSIVQQQQIQQAQAKQALMQQAAASGAPVGQPAGVAAQNPPVIGPVAPTGMAPGIPNVPR